MDDYNSPWEAVAPLLPHLGEIRRFAEPCAGNGRLVAHLQAHGLEFVYSGDLRDGRDALALTCADVARMDADAIVTNRPGPGPCFIR